MSASPLLMRAVKTLAAGGATAATIAGVYLFGSPEVPKDKGAEGSSNAAYRDPIGIPTICGGITQGVYMGQYKTDEECAVLNYEAVETAENTVTRCAGNDMPEPVKAAMISFAYNVGPGRKGVKDGFCVLHSGREPTHLVRLKARDWQGACDALLAWVYAGGQKLRGLEIRRQQERELCLLGIALNPGSSPPLSWSPSWPGGPLTGGVWLQPKRAETWSVRITYSIPSVVIGSTFK